jgi:hypothetical protein
MREELRDMSPSLLDLAGQYQRQPFDGMDFPLFDGESVRITSHSLQALDARSGVFTARVEGAPDAEVILSYVGNAIAGSIYIHSAGRYFDIRNGGENKNYLTQIDPKKMPRCGIQ